MTAIHEIIKLFPQLYVGFKEEHIQTKQEDGTEVAEVTYLGFATPHETNAAGIKRRATVDGWATSISLDNPDSKAGGFTTKYESDPSSKYGYNQVTVPMHECVRHARLVDNVPVDGFKIADNIRRVGWGGGNVVWRVYDPRGYELEISSANLMRIIDAVGMDAGGVIKAKCLWGRLGGQNILIPEGSDQYDLMTSQQTLLDDKHQMKTVNTAAVGDLVSSKVGERIYMGQLFAVCIVDTSPYKHSRDTPSTYEKQVLGPYYALGSMPSDEKHAYREIILYKSNPITGIITPHMMSPEETVEMRKMSVAFASNTYNKVMALVDSKTDTAEYVIEDFDVSTVTISTEGRLIHKRFAGHDDCARELVVPMSDDRVGMYLRVEVDNYNDIKSLQPNSRCTSVLPDDLTPVKFLLKPTNILHRSTLVEQSRSNASYHSYESRAYYNGFSLYGASEVELTRIRVAVEEFLKTQNIKRIRVKTSTGQYFPVRGI